MHKLERYLRMLRLGESDFLCPHCGYRTGSEWWIDLHMIDYHQGRCMYCDEDLISLADRASMNEYVDEEGDHAVVPRVMHHLEHCEEFKLSVLEQCLMGDLCLEG